MVSIAKILKGLFRRSDVIGRMGLGDFMIYMKDISSDRMLMIRLNIFREVDKLFSYDYNKNSVSISIGIALIKGPADYSGVYSNAKSALVMAKKDNKSSFEIFYPSLGSK